MIFHTPKRRICAWLGAASAGVLAHAAPAMAVPTAVTTVDVGNETQLVSVAFSDGRLQGPGTGLIGVDVFHYRNTNNNSTTMVIADGDPVPAVGSRAALLDTDIALNTGIINPGGSGGITAGLSPTATTSGIGLNFNSPVINGPGADLILFELAVGLSQSGDGVTLSALTGGSGFASLSAGSKTYLSGNYTASLEASQLAHRTLIQSLPVNNLNDLETKAANLGATGDAYYNILAVDLSDMGVAIGATASGVFIQGNDIDPTFVAGLTPITATGLIEASASNSGTVTNLDSIIINRGSEFQEIAAADLVPVDVFHWHAASSSNTALSPGGADPGTGNRADALMEDLGLNTGMINPGSAGTLTPAQQATLGPNNSTVNGLGVNFEGGLVNGEGIDFVVFEYADRGAQDSFIINRIDGTAGSLLVSASDYTVFGSNLGTQLITPNSSTLNLFENGSWTAGGSVTQGWAGVGIDLSDLGYALGQIAPGLLFSQPIGASGNVDFVFIAGLPAPPVPEPATASLLGLSLLAMLRRRRSA